MRLHRLTLTAIGPFAATEEIDFDALTGSGLFLLEGPTGAGKSTVLDAITFALYGSRAGSDTDRARLRSHFAPPEREPGIVLELSVHGVRYRLTRVPPHERAKKRGTGTLVDKGRAHLERGGPDGWVSVTTNHREIGDEIGRLLGLTKAQFTQVVLLPQNEFATFLKSDDDKRGELLTKLFGTEIYGAITQQLQTARADAGRERKAAEASVAATLAAALEAAGADAVARDAALELGPTERAAFLVALRDTVAGAEADAVAAAAAAQGAVTTAQDARKVTASILERVERRRSLLARREAHAAGRAAHVKGEAQLTAAHLAEPVRALLDVVAAAEVDSELRTSELTAARASLTDELQGSDRDALRAAAENAGEVAGTLEHAVDLEGRLDTDRAALDALADQVQAAESRPTALRAELDALPAAEQAQRADVDELRRRADSLAAARQIHEQRAAELAAAQRVVELAPLVHDAVEARRTAVAATRRADETVQALHDARIGGMAAELAASLDVDAPCPVCGSISHPAPAEATVAAVTETTLAEARAAREAAERARTVAEDAETAVRDEHARAQAAGRGRSIDELVPLLAEATLAVADAQAAADLLPDAVAALAATADRRTELTAQLGDLREIAVRSRAEHASRTATFAAATAAVEAARDGFTTVAERRAHLVARRDRAQRAADAHTRADAAIAAVAAAEAGAHVEAQRRGFADLASARVATLTPERLEALDAQVSAYERIAAELAGALGSPELTEVADIALDDARDDDHAAAVIQAQAETVRAETARTLATAQEHARRFALLLDELDAAVARYDTVVAETDPVLHLARLATGNAGRRPMELTAYVLRRRFDEVVEAANLRLATMSDGRYELRRTDGVDKRGSGGLTLAVADSWTGDERSPGSLSGGETFFTSLSLALGLADVVKAEAGGVELDTLFVDEGFGSLDPETLENVMDVIDDLRGRGRAVGIVSHVADLKERVHERLEIRRDSGHASTTRVVA